MCPKVKIPTAVGSYNKFNLSGNLCTTSDFFKIKPTFLREMTPGMTLDVKSELAVRLAPLVNPMYGGCSAITRFFWVPFRILWRPWNNFITDTPYYLEQEPKMYSNVPSITDQQLTLLFTNSTFGNATVQTGTAQEDFSLTSNSSVVKYNFTDRGRIIYDLLHGLGIKWNFTLTAVRQFSAFPIIAFLKIYSDWYGNNAYNDNMLIDSLINSLDSTDLQPSISASRLNDYLTNALFAQYQKDYFTSAWDNPVSPNNGSGTSLQMTDQTSVGNNFNSPASLQVDTNGTPFVGRTAQTGYSSVSDYILTALKAATDYLKRKQIVGARVLDRYFAEYNKKLDDVKVHRSSYLGNQVTPIHVSEIYSMADTDTGSVGDYAGKGVGFSKGRVKFTADEFGYLMAITTIIPNVDYVQGADRNVMHLQRLDFWTPEYDSLGMQAISKDELVTFPLVEDYNDAVENGYNAKGVFGYTSRYAEYKRPFSNMTGDFIVNSRNQATTGFNLSTFQISRQITSNEVDLVHSAAFTTGENASYDRIFQTANDGSLDHFIMHIHWDVTASAPMSKLFDSYEFGNDGHSKNINVEVNGTQLD